jgi:hypothetical protein
MGANISNPAKNRGQGQTVKIIRIDPVKTPRPPKGNGKRPYWSKGDPWQKARPGKGKSAKNND